jgi:hypothetical protein
MAITRNRPTTNNRSGHMNTPPPLSGTPEPTSGGWV